MSVWEKARWKAVGVLGRLFLRVWAKTSRITIRGEEVYRRAKTGGKPIILIIWHNRLMLVPYFFRKQEITGLVSPSGDGEIIAQIGLGWGFRVVRGSGSHSMVRAWIQMRQELKKGGELIIIPDGPRGPDRVLKPGCLKLAQESGALLVPWSYSASRKKRLNSWDRFLFFYPFSRIEAIYGKPETISAELDEGEFERERRRIEGLLNALDAEADAHFDKHSSGK
jgi:lysophospholipid acyltransferase (LPLAT)-like uncharacterized protein